jgi:hypothetical protein
MKSCSKCGIQTLETAVFCTACGTHIATQAQFNSSSATASADISEAWQKKFSLIEKAGGPNFPRIRELKFGERHKITFNILAFLFGPIYYLVKGMWKKAISLFIISVILILALELILAHFGLSTDATKFVSGAIFATRANIDFYKRIILKTDDWI